MARGVIDITGPAKKHEPVALSEPIMNMRRLRPRSERSSRWLAAAALMGAIVASAFVIYLAR